MIHMVTYLTQHQSKKVQVPAMYSSNLVSPEQIATVRITSTCMDWYLKSLFHQRDRNQLHACRIRWQNQPVSSKDRATFASTIKRWWGPQDDFVPHAWRMTQAGIKTEYAGGATSYNPRTAPQPQAGQRNSSAGRTSQGLSGPWARPDPHWTSSATAFSCHFINGFSRAVSMQCLK